MQQRVVAISLIALSFLTSRCLSSNNDDDDDGITNSLRQQKGKKAMNAFMACIIVFILFFAMLLSCFKEKTKLSEIDIANNRALRRFHYKRTLKNGMCPGVDDEKSVASSASEWSRRQFT
jgi:hypothetical protein